METPTIEEQHEDDKRLALRALLSVPPEMRVAVFRNFCTACGIPDPGCQCWNDE
jgi:hypothetical protein